MIQPTVINLHPNEQSQQLYYYPLAVKSDRCVGSCNTLNDLSNKVYLPNKTEDSNLGKKFQEKNHICKKDILYYIWNPATINCKNGKYLASISDNSVITCDEIIFAVEKSTISKNIICEKNFLYISLVFLLITITLLIAFSIYFCLIRYKAKQKHLWPYYVTNNKLINVL